MLTVTRAFSGARLRAIRQERKLTQAQTARMSGIPLDTYRDYETGKYAPSADRLAALATALNVAIDDLFADVDQE